MSLMKIASSRMMVVKSTIGYTHSASEKSQVLSSPIFKSLFLSHE
jgi:hypothetical protein